jgi:hypothetical protein
MYGGVLVGDKAGRVDVFTLIRPQDDAQRIPFRVIRRNGCKLRHDGAVAHLPRHRGAFIGDDGQHRGGIGRRFGLRRRRHLPDGGHCVRQPAGNFGGGQCLHRARVRRQPGGDLRHHRLADRIGAGSPGRRAARAVADDRPPHGTPSEFGDLGATRILARGFLRNMLDAGHRGQRVSPAHTAAQPSGAVGFSSGTLSPTCDAETARMELESQTKNSRN